MKNNKLPSAIVLLILTTITIVFWISFKIYQVFSTNKPIDIPSEIMAPINPKIDTDTLNEIERRSYL